MTSLRSQLDWGAFAPLRLKARSVAEGVFAGSHKSPRKGAGVEFGGHRAYVPGDDLRFVRSVPDLAETDVIPYPGYVHDLQSAIAHALRKAAQAPSVA